MNAAQPIEKRVSTTLTVAIANVPTLANAGRTFYDRRDPCSPSELERQIDWLGNRIAALNADVLAVPEVGD